MDLVFKRYQNPFLFLDEFILNNELDECVTYLITEEQDERDWQLYLSLNPLNEKSFIEWKREIYGLESNSSDISMSKEEAEEHFKAMIEKSNNILKNFEPPENR